MLQKLSLKNLNCVVMFAYCNIFRGILLIWYTKDGMLYHPKPPPPAFDFVFIEKIHL